MYTFMGARKYHFGGQAKYINHTNVTLSAEPLSTLLIQPADYMTAKSSLNIDVHSAQVSLVRGLRSGELHNIINNALSVPLINEDGLSPTSTLYVVSKCVAYKAGRPKLLLYCYGMGEDQLSAQ